jgi:hypothetical protein
VNCAWSIARVIMGIKRILNSSSLIAHFPFLSSLPQSVFARAVPFSGRVPNLRDLNDFPPLAALFRTFLCSDPTK